MDTYHIWYPLRVPPFKFLNKPILKVCLHVLAVRIPNIENTFTCDIHLINPLKTVKTTACSIETLKSHTGMSRANTSESNQCDVIVL